MRGKRFWCCAAAIAVVAGTGASALAGGGEGSEEPVTMPVSAVDAEEVYETLTAVMATPPDEGASAVE
jgi:hypothetical protein